MTVALCVLAAIVLFVAVGALSKEATGTTGLRLSWGLHAISILLIVVAVSTHGIWYHADLYLPDIWTAQDALHKAAEGYRSSIDYFNPIGPLMEWINLATLLVTGASSWSLVLANVIVAVVALALTILLLQRRASPITVAVVGLIAVTTALSARDIDSLLTTLQSSMLAPYNRWGWALLAPVAMRAALPGDRVDHIGSALAGIAIAAMLLLKITYGMAAIGIFVVVLGLYPSRWREIAVVFVSTALTMLLLDTVSGGQVGAYFGDIAQSARMPANGVRVLKFVSLLPMFAFVALGCALLMVVPVGGDRAASNPRRWDDWRLFVLILAVGGSGLVVLMQNHYSTEAVTLLLMPLIVVERRGWLAGVSGVVRGLAPARSVVVGIVLLLTLTFPAIDAGFVLAQKVQTARKSYLAMPFGYSAYSDLIVDEHYQPAADQPCLEKTCTDLRRMFSGRDLIEEYCPNSRTQAILAFNFSNPFPALLRSPSPRHMPIWMHTDRSFSRTIHAPGSTLFADVGCLIMAKNDPTAAILFDIYRSDLAGVFQPAGQNDDWVVWRRSNDGAAASR